MKEINGSEIRNFVGKNSATSTGASVVQAPTKNTKIKGDVHQCNYTNEAHQKPQTYDNGKDTKGKATACPCSRQSQSEYNYSQLDTIPKLLAQQQYDKPEWFDCFSKRCQKPSCFNELGVLPIAYPSPGKPCMPEYVRPSRPTEWSRRPKLGDPPEMLSDLKRGIRHPFPITQRRKEMQTQLDKLTDEHEAFAYPPGTRPFVNNVYYLTGPPFSLIENYDIVRRDIHMQTFLECPTRPSLLAFHRDKYKFFRERLPMPQQRIVNIPSNRVTHWHNWVVRPLRTTYSESWRKNIKVPDNCFIPAPSQIR